MDEALSHRLSLGIAGGDKFESFDIARAIQRIALSATKLLVYCGTVGAIRL